MPGQLRLVVTILQAATPASLSWRIGIRRRRRRPARPIKKGCRTVARIDAGIVGSTSAHEASWITLTTAAQVATRDVATLVAAIAVADKSMCFSETMMRFQGEVSGIGRKSWPRFCLSCRECPTGQNPIPKTSSAAAASSQQTEATSKQQPKPRNSSQNHQPEAAFQAPATSHQPPATISQQPPSRKQQPAASNSQQPRKPTNSSQEAPERERERASRESEKVPRQCVMRTERETVTETQKAFGGVRVFCVEFTETVTQTEKVFGGVWVFCVEFTEFT